jgi:hypothetical protein
VLFACVTGSERVNSGTAGITLPDLSSASLNKIFGSGANSPSRCSRSINNVELASVMPENTAPNIITTTDNKFLIIYSIHLHVLTYWQIRRCVHERKQYHFIIKLKLNDFRRITLYKL